MYSMVCVLSDLPPQTIFEIHSTARSSAKQIMRWKRYDNVIMSIKFSAYDKNVLEVCVWELGHFEQPDSSLCIHHDSVHRVSQ